MNEREPYEHLVSAARSGRVPEGFTDSVMAAVDAPAESAWSSPAVRAAAWIAAISVLALRVGCALAVFWSH